MAVVDTEVGVEDMGIEEAAVGITCLRQQLRHRPVMRR